MAFELSKVLMHLLALFAFWQRHGRAEEPGMVHVLMHRLALGAF